MSKPTGYDAHNHAKSLAEAIILQSIEGLWKPKLKRAPLYI